MEPWVSWPIFIGLGATAYFYYTRPGKLHSGKRQGKETLNKDRQDRKQDTPNGTTAQSAKTAVPSDSNEGKRRKQPKEQAAMSSGAEVPAPRTFELETEADDREWAKQLQAAKQGVSMTSGKAGSQTGSTKSKRQRDAGTLNTTQSIDMLRSEEQAFNVDRPPASQDVSDMLEPALAGPSTIRITGEEKPKRQVPKKEESAKETKKQRQNRKKVEERKVLREEEEKERRVLEEKQRRTAREARGEPAKNGLGVSQPPASNAWTNHAVNTNLAPAQHVPRSNENVLLDTFDQDARSTTSSNDQQNSNHTPATAASMSSQDLLSEEAQMEAIRQMNGSSGWNEVKKSKKGKKKAASSPPNEPVVSEAKQAPLSTAEAPINNSTKAPGLPVQRSEPINEYAPLQPVKNLQPSIKAHPDDSDWAVE